MQAEVCRSFSHPKRIELLNLLEGGEKSVGELVEAMEAKGLWKSPGGKTPDATLYASILRDLRKGKDARFKKAAPGKFALNR